MGGYMAHFDGDSWIQVTSPVTDDITKFQVVSATEIYGSVYDGQLIFYDGEKWDIVQAPSRAGLMGVAVQGTDTVWVAGLNGAVLSFVPGTEPECLNTGDVTGDGDITAGDAQLTFEIALGVYFPSDVEACAADCDASGDVTAGDAQGIFNAAMGGSCEDPV